MNSNTPAQASFPDAGNGVDRPLPPLPNPELDLYSGVDDGENHGVSSPQASENVAVEGQERGYPENQGESSRSVPQVLITETLPIEQGISDVKGSRRSSSSMRASTELAGGARSHDLVNLSRTDSTPTTTQNSHLSSNSTTQPETRSQNPQEQSQLVNMDIPGRSPYNGRVQRIEIMPGTANYDPELTTALPQYQVNQRVVLPRWQPDAEVATCPICNSTFNMFNRKHHCRKCGRVVCAPCSPHRITIPREYIVRPPPGVGASPPRVSRPLYGSIHTSGEATIEAGERVRLCNPCVPDPNTAPPQANPPSYSIASRASNEQPVGPDDRLPQFSEYIPGRHDSHYRPRPNTTPIRPDLDGSQAVTSALQGVRVANNPPLQMGYNVHISAGVAPGGSINNSSTSGRNNESHRRRTIASDALLSTRPEDRGRFLTFLHSGGQDSTTNRPVTPPHPFTLPRASTPTTPSSFPPREATFPAPFATPPTPLLFPHRAGTPVTPFPGGSPARRPDQATPSPTFERPTRIIPEGHMCPVCRGEYPPSMLADESRQESHIAQCIEEQIRRTQARSQQVNQPAEPTTNTQTRRGMTKYTATARDAVDNEECQICLDNFLPSQELALLTCFCKYHSECILDWWARHPFKCPIHDHGH